MQTADILRKHVSLYESLRQKECRRRTLFSVLNDIRKGVYADVVLPENLWVVHEECAFPQVQRYLKMSYGIEIDPSGKDVTRHCFVSFDPNIFLRKEFEPFVVDVDLSEAAMSKIRMRYLHRKYIRQNSKM